MRVLVVLFLVSFCFWTLLVMVKANTPSVVLRAMSAVPTEGSEWIALENTSGATISAQTMSIRDVQGSIKTWIVPVLQPYELKMFLGTDTKLSLNNTGDQVELLQGGTVIQTSTPYEELSAGSIWVLLDVGWKEISAENWDHRWPVRDWKDALVPTPSPILSSPFPASTIVPTISPVLQQSETSAEKIVVSPKPIFSDFPTPQESTWWEGVSLPHLGSSAATVSGSIDTAPVWERVPGNFDDEWKIFYAWKRKVWLRLAAAFSFSLLPIILSAPNVYRCYNEACLLDDG